MLSMALELAQTDPVYEDMASKFFEHFVRIADAMNSFGGTGLWDEADGFYYDRLHADGHEVAVPLRSFVGLLPLIAVEVLEQSAINRLPDFKKRLRWFLENRRDLARAGVVHQPGRQDPAGHSVARPAGAAAAPDAGRARISVAVRRALDVEGARRAAASVRVRRSDVAGRVRAGRVAAGDVRRQQQLARAASGCRPTTC